MTKFGNIIKNILSVFGFAIGMTLGSYVYHTYGTTAVLLLAGAFTLFVLAAIGVMYAIDVKKGRI